MAENKGTVMVEVGGAIAPALTAVTQAVEKEYIKIGDSLRDMKSKQNMLEKFDPQQVRKAGREYRTLKREADKLERAVARVPEPSKEMTQSMHAARKAANEAKSSYVQQRSRLKELGDSLRAAGVDTKRCSLEQDRLSKAIGKTEVRMSKMRAGKGGIVKIGKAFETTAKFAGYLGTGIGKAVDFTKKMSAVNAQTAQQEKLAQSLGVSGKAFGAWSALAADAGLKSDSASKMIQNMNTKFGEAKKSGDVTPMTESLKMLGLSFKDLEKLSPEQQFEAIASAIKGAGDAQVAQSAAKKLFGGDATVFFGHLRTMKGGLKDIYAEQAKYNVLSEEGRSGAVKYASAMGNIGSVVSSASAEFFGLIGGALAPFIEEIGPKIGALFNEHRDSIKAFGAMIGEVLPKVVDVAFSLLDTVVSVSDALGGFGNVAAVVGSVLGMKFVYSGYQMVKTLFGVGQAVAPLLSGVFPALIGGIKAVGLAFMSNPIGLAISVAVLAVGRLISAWDKLKAAFNAGGIGSAIATFFGMGGDSEEEKKAEESKKPVIGVVPDDYTPSSQANASIAGGTPRKELLPVPVTQPQASSNQVTDNRTVTINVYAAEGQAPKAVAEAVHDRFTGESGALYDCA